LRAMECGIEARDLRDVWRDSADDSDRREVVWLVKRRQRRQLFELVEDHVVEHDGRGELLAAMHDSMADRRDAQLIRVSGDPLMKQRNQAFMVGGTDTPSGDGLIHHAPALRIGHDESRIRSNTVDRAVIAQGEISPTRIHGERRELDARRSRVEDEDDVRHGAARSPRRVMLFAFAMPTTRPLLPIRSSRLMSSPCGHARALHDGEPCEQAVGVVVATDREQFVEPAVAHVAAGERL
jgi:hypothetical protein